MNHLNVISSPAQIPVVHQTRRLQLQVRALKDIKQHLIAGSTDNEFMLRLIKAALVNNSSTSDDRFADELRRHLTVGGTGWAVLVGLTAKALTGYSPASTTEAAASAVQRAGQRVSA